MLCWAVLRNLAFNKRVLFPICRYSLKDFNLTLQNTENDIGGNAGDMDLRPLYMDVQATTPMDPRVLDAMLPYLVNYYGNPHSRTHAYGWESEKAMEKAREMKHQEQDLKHPQNRNRSKGHLEQFSKDCVREKLSQLKVDGTGWDTPENTEGTWTF